MIEFIVLRHQVSVVQRTKTRRPMLASWHEAAQYSCDGLSAAGES
jgi:hypothetical protein